MRLLQLVCQATSNAYRMMLYKTIKDIISPPLPPMGTSYFPTGGLLNPQQAACHIAYDAILSVYYPCLKKPPATRILQIGDLM